MKTIRISDWSIKRSGAAMTIVGIDFRTGEKLTVAGVDLVRAGETRGDVISPHPHCQDKTGQFYELI